MATPVRDLIFQYFSSTHSRYELRNSKGKAETVQTPPPSIVLCRLVIGVTKKTFGFEKIRVEFGYFS